MNHRFLPAAAAAVALVAVDAGAAPAQVVVGGAYPSGGYFGSPSYYASPGPYGGYNPAYPGPYAGGGLLGPPLGGGTTYALPGMLGGYSTHWYPQGTGVYTAFPSYPAYGGYGAYRTYGGLSYGYRRR